MRANRGTDGHSSLLIRDTDVVNGVEVAKYHEDNYEIVQGMLLSELNEKISKTIDVLICDTEGYDVEILKMYVKANIYPKIIFFEPPGVTGYIPNKQVLVGIEAENYVFSQLGDKYQIIRLESNWLCIKNENP
jgi:hypothetical protein